MNVLKIVTAVGLLAATAACTQTGYDNSYAYNSGYNRSYNSNPYYSSNTSYRSGYYNSNQGYYSNQSGNPFYSQSANAAQRRPYGDMDRDGVRNRNDIDANGDGIPDGFQR